MNGDVTPWPVDEWASLGGGEIGVAHEVRRSSARVRRPQSKPLNTTVSVIGPTNVNGD